MSLLPFHKSLTCGRGAGSNYTFLTLKERDNETGLDYFGARYYGSMMGRFTSADSYGGRITNPQTLNRYAYVLNNPLGYTDPSGHAQEPACGAKKCNASKEQIEEERRKAEAEGIDTIVISGSEAKSQEPAQASPTIHYNADSGAPRDFGGPNLTVGEALQQQKERRENFNRAQYFSIIGYGLGQIFRGLSGIFSSRSQELREILAAQT